MKTKVLETKFKEKSSDKVELQCMECDKVFKRILTTTSEPRCPRCKSCDVDLI